MCYEISGKFIKHDFTCMIILNYRYFYWIIDIINDNILAMKIMNCYNNIE